MNFLNRILRSVVPRRYSMELTEDYLYHSHTKLLNIIDEKGNEELGVQEYLKSVKYAAIPDFAKGLEWFNVSEPLSFQTHLKGKIVVLDFFTYCCINCMHIIPDLREIENEFSVEDGLVVIGVHSAKFENEKISSNILAAVQRYNIGHPVVNDATSSMWKNCDVHCWPTLLILGPLANPIVMLTGEGHKNNLRLLIRNALDFYKQKKAISNHKLPFKSAYHLLPDLKGPLLFPGKITCVLDENNHEILAVSDSGNNRVLIVKSDGSILQQIGGKKLGFRDSSLDDAEFNNPQGLVFQNKDVLFVADTENHAIRKIDLKNKTVETIAGTGVQGEDKQGGKLWTQQAISSPWDVSLYRMSDMDLTFHPDGKPPLRDVLIIAMAGSHQIWALFLSETVWWKCKRYPAGTCIAIAGSGREENRNNMYPHAAAFAQPSGLALCPEIKELYIADSESSSVRRMSLIDGKVTPVVGGDRNPQNLFAFGEKDGSLFEAKLQHLLGLAITGDEKTLFVADTYNHKLKKVDVSRNLLASLTIPSTGNGLSSFKEPAGLCLSLDGRKLYVADTNNHVIKILHLDDSQNVTKIEKMELRQPDEVDMVQSRHKCRVVSDNPVTISEKGGKLIVTFNITFENGLGLTDDAPQSWVVDLPDPTWSAVPKNGSTLSHLDVVINVPLSKNLENNENKIDFVFDIVTCTAEVCLPKTFIIRVPVKFAPGGKTSCTRKLDVVLSPIDVRVVQKILN